MRFWTSQTFQPLSRGHLKRHFPANRFCYAVPVPPSTSVFGTRWAATSYKWGYNSYKWPYNWVTGVITLFIVVITPLITARGPPCRIFTNMAAPRRAGQLLFLLFPGRKCWRCKWYKGLLTMALTISNEKET